MSTLPDPDTIKMFIGQIPKTMEESELKEMLEEFGPVYQIGIIRDKASGQHRGCAFVTFYKRKDAIAAQAALHGMKTMPGVSHPIQMKPAEGQSTNMEDRKLFIGMIPKAFNESDIAELFSPYGTIEDCSVLRDSSGDSKGCAFLMFSSKVSAQNAIRSMHHSRVLESCRSPIVVKLADTQKDKDMRKIHSMQQQQMTGFGASCGQSPGGFASGSNMFNPQVSSMFGQQNIPNNNAVNPFAALAALGSLGLNAQQLQQVVALAAVVAPVLQSGAALGALGQQNPADANNTSAMLQQLAAGTVNQASPTGLPSSGGYGGSAVQQSLPTFSAYGAPSGSQQSTSDGPSGNSDLLTKAYTGIQQYAASFPNAYSSLMSTGTAHSAAAGSQLEGPEGANLFIYNLPEEFRDNDMLRVFLPFGSVLSAKVFVDKSTGQSKCFGFVSYENPTSAQTAIQAMNGFLIGSKRLKVQLKRPKSESKPY